MARDTAATYDWWAAKDNSPDIEKAIGVEPGVSWPGVTDSGKLRGSCAVMLMLFSWAGVIILRGLVRVVLPLRSVGYQPMIG